MPPLTVSQHTELFNVLSISAQILSYLTLALFILSLFFHKMIGIETVQTLQLIYAMTMLSLNQTEAFRVFTSMYIIFGVTPILPDSEYALVQP